MANTYSQDKRLNVLENEVSLGLGAVVDSLGYRIAELEKHIHNTNKCLGYSAAAPEAGGLNSVVAFAVTGGNAAFGTEIQVHNGAVIEAGSATSKFDIGQILIPTVGTANINTYCELLYGSRDAGTAGYFINTGDTISKAAVGVAATAQTVGDTITFNSHGLPNDTRVVFSSVGAVTGITTEIIYYVITTQPNTFQVSLTSGGGVVDITGVAGAVTYNVVTPHGLANGTKIMLSGTMPAQWLINTVYYVVSTATNTFQISLTSGGAAVTVASSGLITFNVLTQTLLTSWYVCSANNTPQQLSVTIPCPRITCNNRLWVRAWSNGATNALGVLFNYHVYTA